MRNEDHPFYTDSTGIVEGGYSMSIADNEILNIREFIAKYAT